MKKLLLILTILYSLPSISYGQTEILEQYFHELRGMEDSTGVTHLFYRLFESRVSEFSCDGSLQTFYSSNDDVYQFNSDSLSDSLKFRSFLGGDCIRENLTDFTVDYVLFNTSAEHWIILTSYGYTFGLTDNEENHFNFHNPIVIKHTHTGDSFYPENILLTSNSDSLYVTSGSSTTIPLSGNGQNWPNIENYEQFQNYEDSTRIPYELVAIHPDIDSLYFAKDGSGTLYRSEHYSTDFEPVGVSGKFRNLQFDADSSHIYSVNSSGLRRSNELGKPDTWDFIEFNYNSEVSKFLSIDRSISGQLYVSDSTDVLFSDNYGESFSTLFTTEHQITGLYKKPGSDILYVLTREELLEVNVETGESISLKQLPVSNEPKPKEFPAEITLNQNYPNPFNPTTVIEYQLPESGAVNIQVFDVTGRRVSVLVNGQIQTTGTHQVSFNASSLSSGIYFYRLQAAGQTITRKMTVVK